VPCGRWPVADREWSPHCVADRIGDATLRGGALADGEPRRGCPWPRMPRPFAALCLAPQLSLHSGSGVGRGGRRFRQEERRLALRLRSVEQKARRLRNVTNGATPHAPAAAASAHREHAFEGQLEPGSWFSIGTIHLRALDVSGPTSQFQSRVAKLDGHRRTLPRQSARESAPRSFTSTLGPVTPESP
jgi:hypothetical protein